MAYMRDPFYVWQDGDNIHIHDPEERITTGSEGVTMPLIRFDELCAMRWAQLNDDDRELAEERAVKFYTGDFGCDALRKQRGLEPMLSVAFREAEMRARKR